MGSLTTDTACSDLVDLVNDFLSSIKIRYAVAYSLKIYCGFYQ